MYREVDLQKYVPWNVIGKSKEFIELFKVLEGEITGAWEEISWVREASFIFTTDPRSIEFWENFLDLESKGTLEERQRAVFIEWNKRAIWTDRSLRQWLDLKLGKGKYEIKFNYNDYNFILDIYTSTDVDLRPLTLELREIIPANLGFSFIITMHYVLELTTRQGDHSWPLWKCGEHKTGMLPRPIFRGEREIIHLDLETGEYTGKEYKYWKGIKAGDRVFSQSDDIVLRQLSPLDGSFKNAKIYELEEE